MRAMRRSLILAALLLSAVNTAPAVAGAACGPLKIMTSLDVKPDGAGRPMITAMINDKPVALLVDTGGSLSSLTKRAVRELNLQTAQSRIELRNIAGGAENLEARLPSIVLGGLRLEGPYFMVLPGPDEGGREIETFGGLLGSEMLRNVDFDFDFAANKVNLISQDHCAGNVVYWPAPAVAVVPFTFSAVGHITFRMELDGRRVNAMLDTGASNTILNLDIARRTFRVDVNAPDVEKVGEIGRDQTGVYRKRFKTISFEGVSIMNPVVTMYPDLMGGSGLGEQRTGSIIREARRGLPDVILGMNVLSEMHVYIASKERKLYITPASPQPASAPASAAK
jgi:predicted aspartyl protease